MCAFVKYEPQAYKLSSRRRENATVIKLEAGPETPPSYTSPTSSSQQGFYERSFIPKYQNSPTQSYHSTSTYEDMSDGRNEARAMRILEIMNDFRTLQHHISSLIVRPTASPPDQASYYLDGYVVLRQCAAESQAILASHYNPGNLGLQAGQLSETEVEKATLQRIILDSSTRRFQAHKIYLRAAAGMRWVQVRGQVLKGDKPNGRHANALRRADEQLREELSGITDEHVMSDLRGADRRKGYWVDEDPALDRMLQWIRMQR
ncbi:uncharacterized protein HMPREF1541_09268 [Cyphellophora europaea CBS 101466]|uniref:Uncharacterized protein n=1 Tax=Cyphellophora europaea (strain CBS 101466) TaxID=1220924 RepID=W2S9T3_CYPE1|nr:uncharacterized protein HMPREF1541_09268 [Cyphellophora europaea CBS 101466]ETN45437.1 hypothetical protein HMPREF1541_09268 [Cyphellophora europaea CBS 101466]